MIAVVSKQNEVRVIDVPKPTISESNEVLISTHKVGIDGTDDYVLSQGKAQYPSKQDHIILGHEAVGVVEESNSPSFEVGDVVVPLVRRPKHETTSSRLDMAPYEDVYECGISDMDGYMSEYFVCDGNYLVPVDPSVKEWGFLIEPISIIEKAMERGGSFMQHKSNISTLILGCGRLGTLAAIVLSSDYNIGVYSKERPDEIGPELVKTVGSDYYSASSTSLSEIDEQFDLVIDAAGHPPTSKEAMSVLNNGGSLCLLGTANNAHINDVDLTQIQNELVLKNNSIYGSVSSGRIHFESAKTTLDRINNSILHQYVTSSKKPSELNSELTESGIKTVVRFS